MSRNTRLYLIAAIGGALPIFLQYVAEVVGRGKLIAPDHFLIFLIISFSLLGLLSHHITSKSREFAALIGGIAAPSLFFALATGTKIGQRDEDPVRLVDFSIVSQAYACCGSLDGEEGSGSGFSGDDGGGGYPVCVDPSDYVSERNQRVLEDLTKGKREVQINFWPNSREGYYWVSQANLFFILAYINNEGKKHECLLRARSAFNTAYIDGFMDEVRIIGSRNEIDLIKSTLQDAVALEIEADVTMPFLDGLWWRLGGIAVPKIDVVSQEFFNEDDYREYRKSKLLKWLRKGDF